MLASTDYNVSRDAIKAVLSAPANIGGVGVMHIPESWLPILGRVGFLQSQVRKNNCTNIEAGTWILAYEKMHVQPIQAAPAEKSYDLVVPTRVKNLSDKSECVIEAAGFYHIPVSLLFAILRTEGGRVGQIHMNNNGSYDMGPAQINSIWLPTLAKAGITRNMVLDNECLNISVGAWVLAQSMGGVSPQNPAVFWQRVGDYNSHTPAFNREYETKVWNNLR